MKVKAFVITLERATQRHAQVEQLQRDCPIPCEPLAAVDGSLLSEAEVAQFVTPRLHRPHYPFALRPGEIGVFLSSRKAWQTIIDQDLQAGLLLEDDVQFERPVFNNALQCALADLREDDFIKFPHKGPTNKLATGHQISTPVRTPLGAVAQIVTRGAAKRLLEATETIDRPVDTFLQMTWITGVTPRVMLPSGIREISRQLGGSTIQRKKRPASETLYRNAARPVYRLQILARSYLHALKQAS